MIDPDVLRAIASLEFAAELLGKASGFEGECEAIDDAIRDVVHSHIGPAAGGVVMSYRAESGNGAHEVMEAHEELLMHMAQA